MSASCSIHDDPIALVRAQRKVREALVAFGVVTGGVAVVAPVVAIGFHLGAAVPLAAGAILTLHAALTIRRLARLRRRVWRVAITARHLVALDAGRRQTSVAWRAVERVEVENAGLTLVATGTDGISFRLHVRRHFAAYVALAHEVVARAERQGCAVWVDGRPWQDLDLSALGTALRPTAGTEA
ncbi:MAG: hypothetical protein AAF791_12410 [Bacteroidota bacterium]